MLALVNKNLQVGEPAEANFIKLVSIKDLIDSEHFCLANIGDLT